MHLDNCKLFPALGVCTFTNTGSKDLYGMSKHLSISDKIIKDLNKQQNIVSKNLKCIKALINLYVL